MIKIPAAILPLPLFININWLVINNVCDWFCTEAVHFLYFVQSDLLEIQRFYFQYSSCHSFNTSSFLCEYKINHYIEFITGQKFLVFFLPTGFYTSKVSGLNDCKSCHEKVSVSLAEGKLHEKNEWKISNQSGEVMYASIYLPNRRKSFFFSVTLFRVWLYSS